MGTTKRPRVAVLMGSDSDLSTMREAEKMLDRFGVSYVTRITSAHRTPERTADIVKGLDADGIDVFVVGAGLAAHLAGVVASYTTRPVIGVPMDGGPLSGIDALYATVQMPSGIPVATVAVGKHGAKNAGILAVQILSQNDQRLRELLQEHREEQRRSVEEKDRKLADRSAAASEGD
jgi:phosphoribosylaminoimidazole carboxylase PurE protein